MGTANYDSPLTVQGKSGAEAIPISIASGSGVVTGAAADGAAVAGNPVLIAGSDGTNAQTMLTDTTGRQIVQEKNGYSASAAFTPAAASHVASDVNGGAATFALGAPASSVFEIMSATLLIAGATIETTAWTLHLYSVTPPSALADDAAFDIPAGDRASYLGFVSLAQVVDYGSSLYIETNSIGKRVQLAASGNLFGYLVNGTTLTPQAVAHTVTLIGRAV